MRVVERFCRGKRPDQSLNEDGLVVCDGFAAVVDGVTSKSVRHLWEPSGGVVAKGLLLDEITRMPADADMREAQRCLDARLRSEYGKRPGMGAIVANEPWERLQANAVVYSARLHEAWLFGDCQIMVNGVQTPTVKKVDVLLGEVRSYAMHAMMLERQGDDGCANSDDVDCDGRDADASGFSVDPARAMLEPLLRLQTMYENRRGEYGYFVFDGFTDVQYPIRVVQVRPGDDVVLASDGYPLLRGTLAESERELRRLRDDDPQLIDEYRSTKGFVDGLDSFDDRTYLRFIA